jgi:hypothetical protein
LNHLYLTFSLVPICFHVKDTEEFKTELSLTLLQIRVWNLSHFSPRRETYREVLERPRSLEKLLELKEEFVICSFRVSEAEDLVCTYKIIVIIWHVVKAIHPQNCATNFTCPPQIRTEPCTHM